MKHLSLLEKLFFATALGCFCLVITGRIMAMQGYHIWGRAYFMVLFIYYVCFILFCCVVVKYLYRALRKLLLRKTLLAYLVGIVASIGFVFLVYLGFVFSVVWFIFQPSHDTRIIDGKQYVVINSSWFDPDYHYYEYHNWFLRAKNPSKID